MTPEIDSLEQLLTEHAAVRECGLLADAPSTSERRRLAGEMARSAKPVRPPPSWQRQAMFVGVAAAVLAVVVGLWALLGGRGQPPVPVDDGMARDNPPPLEAPRVEFLNGRGRLLPAGESTRYTLVDAIRGRVRLERGELYVELPVGADLQADIETPAGTATALGTSFYAHYEETSAVPKCLLLTVAVVGGFVEVRNSHGQTMAGAGEVVLAEGGSAPRRHSGSASSGIATPPERNWWRLGSALGMLHRPEVQAELKLTPEQLTRLQKPSGEDWREVGKFFRDLSSVAPEERARKAPEFRGAQEKKIAEVLDAEQQRRLGQILLQQQGYAALVNQEVADPLQLTEEQRRQVQAVAREFSQARRSAFSRGSWNWPEAGKRMDELHQKESEKLATLLTDAQQEQWRSLVGEPFELKRRAGDWRDWWDFGIGMDPGRGPENWRGPWGPGPWGPGPGGWRWGPPSRPGPER